MTRQECADELNKIFYKAGIKFHYDSIIQFTQYEEGKQHPLVI